MRQKSTWSHFYERRTPDRYSSLLPQISKNSKNREILNKQHSKQNYNFCPMIKKRVHETFKAQNRDCLENRNFLWGATWRSHSRGCLGECLLPRVFQGPGGQRPPSSLLPHCLFFVGGQCGQQLVFLMSNTSWLYAILGS